MEIGPEIWRNWQKYDASNVPESFEVALYSDANFTSHLRRTDWPLDLIPTFPDFTRPGVQQALVARVRWCLALPASATEDSKSDYRSYHGGGIEDEIASLVSMALGVRCRSGGVTRRWWRRRHDESEYDPLGYPIEHEHRSPTWKAPGRGRAMLPTLAEQVGLQAAVPLLELLPKISDKKAVALVRAARLYSSALWVADDDPNLAWLQLVSAIEVAAVLHIKSTKPAWKRVERTMPELWKVLITYGDDHAQQVGTMLADQVRSVDRFSTFMAEFLPGPPAQRPQDFAQIDWNEIPGHLQTIYKYRSEALHNGTPFPGPMCEPPAPCSTDALDENPLWLWSQHGASTWAAKNIPMYLHMFEYLVREALIRWWSSLA